MKILSTNQNLLTALMIALLLIGFAFRLILSSNGNFIFNMDNARDWVDVREMVIGHKLRLTGPTSAIDGFYNGPAWYYLLSVPFVLSQGHPYAPVLMMIVLWAIGGYFLLKLVSRYGTLVMVIAGLVWSFSNYLTLATSYAFNPHPVTLLAPLFIYLLEKYLLEKKGYFLILAFFLGGLFFNFEMNSGVFMPIIIMVVLFIDRGFSFLKNKDFWLGCFAFAICLLPQLLFDLKHQFIMSTSVIKYLGAQGGSSNLFLRISLIWESFFNVFVPTYFNQKYFVQTGLVLVLFSIFVSLKNKQQDLLLIISLAFILVPFVGYVFIPVNVNPWHLGPEAVASIILLSFAIGRFKKIKPLGVYLSVFVLLTTFYFVYLNLEDFVKNINKPNNDPSSFKNELRAVDYVYNLAGGKDFKIYSYLPSVIDYPQQYIIWWRGLNKYGYLPSDYAYLPNKPKYIPNKELFESKDSKPGSGLIFLVKEPDRINQRHLWENNFKDLKTVSINKLGPIEIEVKSELK